MIEFYFSDGQNQLGPFSLEELRTKNIKRNTLVWYEGIEEWTEAGKLDELSSLFKSIPPPIQKKTEPPVVPAIKPAKKKSKTGLIVTIIIVVVLLATITLFALFYNVIFPNSNNSNSGSPDTYEQPREKTPQELREELYEKERNNPGEYITVSYDIKFDLFQGDLVKGTLYNTATIASFKDVVLTIIYYSETSTELKRENKTVYEYVRPNKPTDFKLKVSPPRDCKKIGVEIYSAVGE